MLLVIAARTDPTGGGGGQATKPALIRSLAKQRISGRVGEGGEGTGSEGAWRTEGGEVERGGDGDGGEGREELPLSSSRK